MYNALKEESFRNRLQTQMAEKGYSKTSLAKELNKKFGTGYTHNDVHRWLNTGLNAAKPSHKNKGGHVAFPRMETIFFLSALFGVDIGYLLGETDMETYSLEKACNYTGLDQEAIKNILKICGKGNSCLSLRCESVTYRQILNSLFSSPLFLEFIEHLMDLHTEWTNLQNEKTRADEINCNEIDSCIDAQREITYKLKISRYELLNAYERLIRKIYPIDQSET